MGELPIEVRVVDRGELSRAEAEVLAGICQGRGVAELAETRFRSVKTVGAQVESIYRKLGVHSAAQAVSLTIARGMVQLSLKSLCLALALSFVVAGEQAQARPATRVPRPVSTRVRGSRD